MTQPDFAARNQVDVLVRERAEALTMRWLAATAAIGALAVLLSILANTIPEEVSGFIVLLCWLTGIVLTVLSVVLPRIELADAHIAKWVRAPVDPYRWAKQMRLSNAQKDVFIALPPAEQSLVGLTMLFERPFMLGLGLSLGVALVGFVYGLVTRTVLEASPFLTAALALNCWHYPRLTKLIDRGRSSLTSAEDEAEARALADLQRSQPPKPQRNTPRLRRSRTSDRP